METKYEQYTKILTDCFKEKYEILECDLKMILAIDKSISAWNNIISGLESKNVISKINDKYIGSSEPIYYYKFYKTLH